MTTDRQHAQRCMAQVQAYRACCMKAKVWAEANGVPLGTLGRWCAHHQRWQARRDARPGDAGAEPSTTPPTCFVAVERNGDDPWPCLKDVFERLSRLEQRDLL